VLGDSGGSCCRLYDIAGDARSSLLDNVRQTGGSVGSTDVPRQPAPVQLDDVALFTTLQRAHAVVVHAAHLADQAAASLAQLAEQAAASFWD